MMIRKALVGTGVALLVGLFFFGRDMVSYVRTSVGYVKSAVTDSVPTEFQIERARGMIDDLVPEIRKNMQVIAREEVEVEQLNRQIADARGRLDKDKADILRLKTDLTGGDTLFHYAGRQYTSDQVKLDLANRFQRYQTGEATLASLEDIHTARQKSLDAARQKLEGMMAQKRQLKVEVENLEARLQMVSAAQTTSQVNVDDSKLGRVRELIDSLKTKLDVAERMIHAEGQFHDQIPLDQEAPADIVEKVTQYFEKDQDHPQAEAVARK